MKDDEIALRIEAFDAANGGGVGWYEDKGAYHLYLLETEAPIARLKPVGTTDEVRLGYWSHLSSGNLGLFRTLVQLPGHPRSNGPSCRDQHALL
jgi:hypothetical protein